jgi:hypothetical protein
MVTVLGIPLIGTLFIPTLLGFLTFYVIWSLSTRKKDASCTDELLSAAKGPSDSALTVNNVGSKPKKKVFGNRASSVSAGHDDNSCSEGDSLSQVKLHYTSNSKRKVFGSKVGELTSLSLQLENDLTKKNTRKKHCEGKARCCSKKKGASNVLEGTIDTVKVFFGTQTGKSKVNVTFLSGMLHLFLVLVSNIHILLLLPSVSDWTIFVRNH